MNENFTKELVGLEKRIGNAILDDLYRTIAEAYEFQVRWKWSKNAVAIWDNRSTFHTGIFDYCKILYIELPDRTVLELTSSAVPHLRHGLRVAPQAETPFFDPASKTRQEALLREKKGSSNGSVN